MRVAKESCRTSALIEGDSGTVAWVEVGKGGDVNGGPDVGQGADKYLHGVCDLSIAATTDATEALGVLEDGAG